MNLEEKTAIKSPDKKTTYMTPLSDVMEKIRVRGYDNEFVWTTSGFTIGRGKFYQPHDLVIIKVYRFEGDSDPADESILYILKAYDGLIGYSLDMYGIYSNHDEEEGYDRFIGKTPVEGREGQLLFSD